MDENYKDQLVENGVHVDAALRRFLGKADKYKKFLEMFLKDDNCVKCGEALEQKDYGAAFNCAHTLKGVAANLGLMPISDATSDLVELLRNKSPEEIDEAQTKAAYEKMNEAYERLTGIIKEHM